MSMSLIVYETKLCNSLNVSVKSNLSPHRFHAIYFAMHIFLMKAETVSNGSNVCITSEINMYKPASNCRRKDNMTL